MARGQGAGLSALILTVFTGLVGFGIFIPIFPCLALDLGASAHQTTLAMGAYSLGQLIAAPAWGRLSDRIGRKPVLIIGLAGGAMSYVLLTFADSWATLGAARLFGGLMAGNIGAAFAAAADLADERTRARNMGLLGATFAGAFIIGPGVGALIIGDHPSTEGYHRICFVAAGFTAAAGLYAATSGDGLEFRTSALTGIPGGNPNVIVRADGVRMMYLSSSDGGGAGVRAVRLR